MKKITFLLTLLGLSASSAFAGVFKPSTDSETHVYAIKNANKTNFFCSLNGANIGSTSNIGSVAYFKVENGGSSNQYYLYCLNNKKYVTFTETTNSETGAKTYSNITFADSKADAKQWKIKLETNQSDRYDILPNTVTDETSGSSWNWVGGVGNNLGFWAANDGNSSWTFVEAKEGTYTFSYSFGGKERFKKTTIASIVGSDKSAAPTSDARYTRVESMTPANIEANTTEYTVNLVEEGLPFTTSTDYANAKWFIIDMHNNDSGINGATENYVWTYDVTEDHNHNVILPITNLKSATYTDNMLWCFIGNVFDGFKIYNKAAGKSYTLRKANTTTNTEDETNGNVACVMSTEDTNNLFKLYSPTGTGANISGKTFCLKLDDDAFYVNTQKPDGYNNKVLLGWKEADGGSTCRVFVPGSAIIDNALTNYRNVYTKAEGALANAVGANSYLETGNNYNDFVTIYDAIQNNTATVEQINAFKEVKNSINTAAANETTIEAGKNYRLYNAKDKKYLFIKLYNGGKTQFNNKNVMSTKADKGNSVLSVVTFEKDGETGRFHMMMGDKTLGKRVGNDLPILLEDATSGNKGSYRVDHVGTTFRFYDQTSNVSDRSYLHCNNQNDSNDSNLCGWDAPLTNINPSLWYVVPATTAEIDMNTVGDKSYATAYLPYAISNVEGAEVYTGTLNTTNDALDMTQIQGGIPANNGVVLVGAANAKATLTLGESTANITSNSLVGTNLYIPFTTEAPRGNYLVFGKNEGTVGFYVPSAKVTSIPANKAYLNKPASSSIVMNFGGNTTGVNTVVLGENGVNAPVFDLSGRRVIAPVKGGVYIQNGKKFIK